MPTERKQIRLILDAGTEHQVIDAARKEGRSVSAMVNRMVNESLSARRPAACRASRTDADRSQRQGGTDYRNVADAKSTGRAMITASELFVMANISCTERF